MWGMGRVVVHRLDHAGRPGTVSAVDLGVDGSVGVAGGEDAVVGVGEDGGEGLHGALSRPVEHLGLELGELVLEVGEVVGEGVDDRGVHRSVEAVVGGAQVLGTLQRGDVVAPELGLLGEGVVVGVEVEVHLADTGVTARHFGELE